MRMQPLGIVEPLDVVADRGFGCVARRVAFVVDQLDAQRGEEALSDGIVPTIALAAHAGNHSSDDERLAVIVARVPTRSYLVGVLAPRPTPTCRNPHRR